MRTEPLICEYRRTRLCTALGMVGCHRFFDFIEGGVIGDWRLHLFSADLDALSLVFENTDGIVGPGDPVGFDPQPFIEHRLQRLEKSNLSPADTPGGMTTFDRRRYGICLP